MVETVPAALTLSQSELLRTRAYVAGSWIGADSGRTFPVTDPATGQLVAEVPRMGATETRRAIRGADEAWPGWRAKAAKQRAAILRRWADLMHEHTEDLARLMTAEGGKPFVEARGEIAYAASFIEWFGEQAKRLDGDVIPTPAADRRLFALKEPIGVTGAITPWNFPAAMITRKAGSALGAGCPMVVKPAEQTPLTALALAKLAEWAGVPAGVFSVVTGDTEDAPEIGGELTGNPVVRKISFTGSTEVGKALMRQAAGHVQKVTFELGGNAPFVVFDDADLDAAVEGLVASKFRNAGQTCVCANRVLVQDGVYDTFLSRFTDAVRELKVGNGFEEGVQIGPLIDERGTAKARRHVDEATGRGAEVLVGGHRHELGGNFFAPTVLSGVTNDMLMSCEETFGPVAGLQRFRSEEEALRVCNDTPYGLAAYFYSRDVGRIWRVTEGLEYGIVGANTGLISTEVAPFGGVKESGIGREGSKYGIEEWVEIKYLALAGLDR